MPRLSLRSLRPSLLAIILGVGGALAPAAAACAKATPVTPLTISPAPGTPDANPATGISVLGVPSAQIASVSVTGAVSGAHPGRLRPFSRSRGAIFVPATALTEGESVKVAVRVRGRSAVRFTFTVARLGATPPILQPAATQPDKLEHYVSEPDLTPPRITVLKRAPKVRDSIFLTPLPSPIVHPGSTQTVTISPVGPGGPMILDGNGKIVWFNQITRPSVAANLRLQRFEGRTVMTWWQGPVTAAAFGLGEGVIADTSYRTIRKVRAGNGYPMDIHEFTLTPDGDALFPVYSPVKVHLPGTPEGTLTSLIDAIVQAVDVRTGLVTWEWHSLGHIPIADSYATPQNSAFYDVYHINSVQSVPGGRVVISARDTSAIYEIERATGRILWTLGGKSSDFKLGPGARFWFQHDAQLLGGDRVSMFDDEGGPPQKAPASRGLVLALDLRRRRATVVSEYRRSNDTSAQSEGSLQSLPGGDMFAGFGSTPFFSRFTKAGKLVFDAKLPQDDGSYRVYSFPWSATPTTRPAVAARRVDASTVSVYASWNGATTVARWQVLAGADAGSLKPVGASTRRSDFETRIGVTSSSSTFAVQAVDARGRVLATSAAVDAT